VLVFLEVGKLEYPQKNPPSKAQTSNKLNPHMALGWNRTWDAFVGGEGSHHYVIPDAPSQI